VVIRRGGPPAARPGHLPGGPCGHPRAGAPD